MPETILANEEEIRCGCRRIYFFRATLEIFIDTDTYGEYILNKIEYSINAQKMYHVVKIIR